MSRIAAVALAALVTMATLSVAVVGGAAGAAQPSESHAMTAKDATADGEAYAGTHVAFETSSNAIVDYRVDDETVFENVTVASQSDHQSRTEAGADARLSAVVDLSGLGLSLDAQSETRADVATDGSASLSAHDTERGILTVNAGEDAQYVELNLSEESNATASDEGDRVLVETENRTGALVVAGDGEVAVNDNGDVTADLGSESTLVFRSYESGERDENAEEQERLIAEGTATAEVYADAVDGERVVDVATYGHDTAVETGAEAEERLEMSVERAESEGKIVIVSVSEAALEAVGSAEDLAVTVDGEAAAEVSSYSELEGGIGEDPRYMVTSSSDAEAAADVLVAIDHFSERDVAIQSADDVEHGDDGDSMPGFGAGAALIAALIGVGARVRS
ncbi:hypothetical protein Htur_3213 [Haloterrigena turkmenica DSM 5511]|uniref:PGF-CTERM sorting domain-containing protein n=1 Tax=Haloterrigena turkmenica (strain ATCC 51198 / DSM 5511 / JCM 9101 / NCIMB 13204 / VKM B-1734 / 4k) TaxID=543526 RepID=D2RZN9_HALTV|nr:hypothetical protein [Haloterrigena turkmenica]ADB62078.1 hypothetical protein Htur_3213 [Haloterrigena turkmenica DSM 5511]